MDLENCFSVGHRMEYKIYISRHPRDAVAAVHRYLISVPSDETVRVYAVGGDGILFDCLNGMVNFPNAELTSVPYGTANDFVRAFGNDAADAFRDIKKLSRAPSRKIDIIHCGANYGLIEVNIGLVGMTVINANKLLRVGDKKDWLVKHTPKIYNIAAIKTMMDKELLRQEYTIWLDNEDKSGRYCNIHIANIACDGGAFVPSPYSMPNDGALEAIFMGASKPHEIFRVISDRNKGTFEKHKQFSYNRCKRMYVKSQAPMCIQIDGESFVAQEMNIEIISDGIKVFAPENLEFEDYSHFAYRKKDRGEQKA